MTTAVQEKPPKSRNLSRGKLKRQGDRGELFARVVTPGTQLAFQPVIVVETLPPVERQKTGFIHICSDHFYVTTGNAYETGGKIFLLVHSNLTYELQIRRD